MKIHFSYDHLAGGENDTIKDPTNITDKFTNIWSFRTNNGWKQTGSSLKNL